MKWLLLVMLIALMTSPVGAYQGLLSSPESQLSETGVIRGKVTESVSAQVLEYVNVVVFPSGSEQMLTGGISGIDGTFQIPDIPFGQYDIRFSFIGFENTVVEGVSISRGTPLADLGIVELRPTQAMMEAVTVTGERDLLMFNLDKTIYAVDRDMTATGGSALDLMESIPSVAVDSEGRISLRGSTQVTILIDGRPSFVDGIDQIPATMIDRIEVITNPSARYDPDGTSGIINIVMKRQRQQGVNGMVSLNMGTGDKYNGTLHINRRTGLFNLFGNYDFRVHGMEGYNINDRERITPESDTLRHISQYEEFFRTGYFHNFRLGADLFPDDKNTLMFSAGFNWRDTRPRNYSEVQLFFPSDNQLSTSMERQFEGFAREYVLHYTRSFDQDGRELVADIFYAASSGDTYRDIEVHPVVDGFQEIYHAQASAPGTVFTAQIDYVQPVSDGSRFEVGLKTIRRNIEDDFMFYDIHSLTGERMLNPDFTNYFLYDEWIHAAYGIFALSAGRFQFQGGVRAEYHWAEAEQRATDIYFDRTLENFFPSAHIRYALDEQNAFFMNFSKRVNRPGIALLNPFVNYSDPMNISFGNPELRPEYIHSYELGYQHNQNRKGFGATLFYRQTDDIISREMALMGGNNPQTHTTFQNLQSGISYGLETMLNHPLARWWRLTASASYFYTKLEDDRLADWQHSGDSWMLQASSSWTIRENYNLQARFHYRSAEVTAGRITGGGCQQHGGQGILDAMYYLDLGLSRNVLSGNGSISLRLNDVFKSRNFDMYTYGESFTSDLSRRTQSRVLFIGFTYRFNEYRQRSERQREGSLLDELD